MAKKLTKFEILTIYCNCGAKLAKYKKGPGRKFIKMHKDRITKDYYNIFLSDTSPEHTDILCPECTKRIATIQIIGGKYINKLNQGQIHSK